MQIEARIAALREFRAEAESTASAANRALGGISMPPLGDSAGVRQAALAAQILALTAWVDQLRRSGNIPGAINASDRLGALQNRMRIGDYYTGGYTGDGGKFEPKGIVHGGEFVFDKQATANIGVDELYALQAAARRGRFSINDMAYAQAPSLAVARTSRGGGGGNGPQTVMLDPYDRQLLENIADRVGLTIDGDTLQRVAGAGNVSSTRRGTR